MSRASLCQSASRSIPSQPMCHVLPCASAPLYQYHLNQCVTCFTMPVRHCINTISTNVTRASLCQCATGSTPSQPMCHVLHYASAPLDQYHLNQCVTCFTMPVRHGNTTISTKVTRSLLCQCATGSTPSSPFSVITPFHQRVIISGLHELIHTRSKPISFLAITSPKGD